MCTQFPAKAGATIERLFADLEAFEKEYTCLSDEAGDDVIERLNDIQWTIRGQINAMPARTTLDFRLKVLVFKKEAERDTEFGCNGLGSARELAKSLIDDALAMIAVV